MKHSAKALARQAKTQQASTQQASTHQASMRQASMRQASTGAAAGARQRVAAQLPYWIVLAGVAAGLATVRSGGQAVRGGTLVIAGALLAGSLARLVLPAGKAGMLGSRRRLVDVAVLGALGVGLLVAGLIVVIPSS
ncbi:MAG TPA: DUF3017 domain-containing protein [Streptosporangiaceae bacterium]|nr:DUF3017 domain-containing protein [Streptosporangiaceae bacterium]